MRVKVYRTRGSKRRMLEEPLVFQVCHKFEGPTRIAVPCKQDECKEQKGIEIARIPLGNFTLCKDKCNPPCGQEVVPMKKKVWVRSPCETC